MQDKKKGTKLPVSALAESLPGSLGSGGRGGGEGGRGSIRGSDGGRGAGSGKGAGSSRGGGTRDGPSSTGAIRSANPGRRYPEADASSRWMRTDAHPGSAHATSNGHTGSHGYVSADANSGGRGGEGRGGRGGRGRGNAHANGSTGRTGAGGAPTPPLHAAAAPAGLPILLPGAVLPPTAARTQLAAGQMAALLAPPFIPAMAAMRNGPAPPYYPIQQLSYAAQLYYPPAAYSMDMAMQVRLKILFWGHFTPVWVSRVLCLCLGIIGFGRVGVTINMQPTTQVLSSEFISCQSQCRARRKGLARRPARQHLTTALPSRHVSASVSVLALVALLFLCM